MSDVDTELIQGNCIDVMGSMEPESVHAIVTDPPYGLAFMGNSWDDFEPKEYQEWCEEWATEALRVLKPGGHMLAFSGSRTFHRLFVGVEDAGFEVRDTIMWMYGSGFPKGQDIGKAIDKKKGVEEEREVVGKGETGGSQEDRVSLDASGRSGDISGEYEKTKAAASEAKKWDGWNSQLKPAFEPIVVARKPLGEDTIAEQVMTTGTGALNIDGCRIGDDVDTSQPGGKNNEDIYGEQQEGRVRGSKTGGRHPANVALDEDAARMLDEQTGELAAGGYPESYSAATGDTYGSYSDNEREMRVDTGTGGASRFFYTSKAKKSERTVGGRIENPHPTVKPIDLMEWMITLVSAEEQTVLDPFAGTGATLMAAYNVGRNAIGIEKDSNYMKIAKERVRANEEHIDEVGTEPDHVYNEATGW